MYIYEYTQTLTYMMFITELFTKLPNKLLGLNYMNACVWVERKQITMCSIWFHQRWNHFCVCASMGQSPQKVLKVSCKRQVLIGMLFSSAVTSLYKIQENKQTGKLGGRECGSTATIEKTDTSNSISLNVRESQYPCCKDNRWFKPLETNRFFVWH